MKPSDELKQSAIYKRDPRIRDIMHRYEKWTPENWKIELVMLDLGYLLGKVKQLSDELEKKVVTKN